MVINIFGRNYSTISFTSFFVLVKYITVARIAIRKIALVIIVPDPKPLLASDCESSSPMEAPSGHVQPHFFVNISTVLLVPIFMKKY